jgi:hypothetical protein
VKEVNPVAELQPLKFTDSVPNSMTVEVPDHLVAGNTAKPNNIEFRLQGDNAPQEIIRLDSEGFHYRGQLIEDAGEAHQLMVEFLKQSTQSQPEPAPTDEELMAAARKAVDTYPRGSELPYFLSEDSCEYEPMLLALRAAARWSMPTNNIWRED